jgi:hypothetical protein
MATTKRGKDQAKLMINKAKLSNAKDLQLASTAKNGKEFAAMLLLDIGSVGGLTSFNVGQNLGTKFLERRVAKQERRLKN